MTNRVFRGGRADLQGRKVNTLTVGDVATYTPFRWKTVCGRCGVGQTHSHEAIASGGAQCQSSGCGKQGLHEAANETLSKARQKAKAAEAEKQRRREQAEAEKVAAIEAEYQKTHRELGKLVRERILAGKDDEVASIVSEDTRNISMSLADAEKYNIEQAALFVKNCPEYERYRSRKTLETIGKYIDDHKIAIVSAETLRGIFQRLRDYGLLEENPAPTPERIEVSPEPALVNLSVEPEQPKKPEGEMGIDPATGLERFYTNREIALMSADDYRRTFRIYRDALQLPNHAAF